MKLKTFKDILLLKPAITSRNFVTLGLVLLFFGICVASGMKITGVPDVKPGTGFGGIESDRDSKQSIRDEVVEDLRDQEQVEQIDSNVPESQSNLMSPRERLEASIRESARERNPIRAGETQPREAAASRVEEQPVVQRPRVEEVREEIDQTEEQSVADELSEIEKRLNLKNR